MSSNQKNFALVLTLICGAMLSSVVAFADSEAGNDRRAEGIMRRIEAQSLPEVTPYIAVNSGAYVIYRHEEGEQAGAAARVTGVRRSGTHLFVYQEFSTTPHVMPYLTKGLAEGVLRRVVAGLSVDLSGCMEAGRVVSSRWEVEGGGPVCQVHQVELRVSCGLLTRIPLVTSVDARHYELRDIVASPLMEESTRCLRDVR